MGEPALQLSTWADIEERILKEDRRLEIIGGDVLEKAAPDAEHASSQAELTGSLVGPFSRGIGGPGGWWLMTEPDIALSLHDVYRPDIAGWRRDRSPQRPRGLPIRDIPDWVCEVLSPCDPRGAVRCNRPGCRVDPWGAE